MTRTLEIALLLTMMLALLVFAPKAGGHYQKLHKVKGKTELARTHYKLHARKGHAWAMVKHPRTYKSLVWHRKALRRINRSLARVHSLMRFENSPQVAICQVFGPYCDQALRVVYCETGGTYDTNASNGQYLGLFQMGSYARSRYGHSSTALGQARAAYRYFVDSGRDWSPWSCKP